MNCNHENKFIKGPSDALYCPDCKTYAEFPSPPNPSIHEAAENNTDWEDVPECVLKAVGLLTYLKHDVDYLSDDLYEWIGKVINAIECAEWQSHQSLQQPREKSLQECKDEVALSYAKRVGLDTVIEGWKDLSQSGQMNCFDDLVKLYASSQVSEQGWVDVKTAESECPNCGEKHTELSCGGYCSASCLQESN